MAYSTTGKNDSHSRTIRNTWRSCLQRCRLLRTKPVHLFFLIVITVLLLTHIYGERAVQLNSSLRSMMSPPVVKIGSSHPVDLKDTIGTTVLSRDVMSTYSRNTELSALKIRNVTGNKELLSLKDETLSSTITQPYVNDKDISSMISQITYANDAIVEKKEGDNPSQKSVSIINDKVHQPNSNSTSKATFFATQYVNKDNINITINVSVQTKSSTNIITNINFIEEQQRSLPPSAKTTSTSQQQLQQRQQQKQQQEQSQQQQQKKQTATPVHQSKAVCLFPDLDPLDPGIKPFFEFRPTIRCNGSKPVLVYTIGGDTLKVNQTKVKEKMKHGVIDGCRYRQIQMAEGNDKKLNFSEWSEEFNTSIRLTRGDEEYIEVQCTLDNELVSVSYHYFVREKPEVEKKRDEDFQAHLKKSSPEETLSVLMVGTDGMSRQNFFRAMPKTRFYLMDEFKAIELKHHNKVGLNTFPNVFPLLTGKHPDDVDPYWRKNFTNFDPLDHLFLWNRYQKAGYRTAIMFDNYWMTAFHYMRKGWHYPPFDYYNSPLVMASSRDKTYRKVSRHCMGDTPEITMLFNYWLEMTSLFNSSRSRPKPYFLYSFFSMLTHDYQHEATAGDELYLQFLKELKKRNVLNNTVFVFFSDHGSRFGNARMTYNGIFEARNPMMFFAFPPWFERKYPEIMTNFRQNANDRLTTNFDVHETLRELLTFTGSHPRNATSSSSSSSSPVATRGASLFSEISANRTCETASIPEKFCGCEALRKTYISSPVLKVLVKQLIKDIVEKTDEYRDKCVALELQDIVSVLSMVREGLNLKNAENYHVGIKTVPGGGKYEASMSYSPKTKRATIVGGISRVNLYRGQVECLEKVELWPYCYCVRNLT